MKRVLVDSAGNTLDTFEPGDHKALSNRGASSRRDI